MRGSGIDERALGKCCSTCTQPCDQYRSFTDWYRNYQVRQWCIMGYALWRGFAI